MTKAQKIADAIEKVYWDWGNMEPSHPHVIAVATLQELINQCAYNNFNIDGDHGIDVVNVKDIMTIIEELENY